MITDAVWIDFDGDGRLDLVTVGEWMPIQFYRNDGKRLRNVTQSTRLPPLRGWWYSLAAADFDNDGDPDLVAGNLGLNYSYTTSADSKFGVYAANFTGNQTTDIVLTQTIDGTEYSVAGLAPLGREIYSTGCEIPDLWIVRAGVRSRQLFSAAQLRAGAPLPGRHVRQRLSAQRRRREVQLVAAAQPRADRTDQSDRRPRRGRRRPSRSDRGGESLRRRAEYAEGRRGQRTLAERRRPGATSRPCLRARVASSLR